MSELSLFLLRVGYLALLWIFVLAAVSVIRSDLFGARTPQRTAATGSAEKSTRQKKQAKTKKPKTRRGSPTHMVLTGGSAQPERTDLVVGQGPLLIGRGSDSQIRLEDDYASTRHAHVAFAHNQWYVEDLGSTNGTYVDDQRIIQPTSLPVGSVIRIGKTLFELRK